MCGLVTIVTPPGREVSAEILEAMTTRLSHRGPDDFGYACIDPHSGQSLNWVSRPPSGMLSGILIGHRRLSILDLTEGGHQPMSNDDGSIVIAFNGEIYNFLELRQELESLDVPFRSRSDTEVLLKAYEHWGEAAFQKFNGMWAFAIWDGRTKKLVLSRDRFGVKPLYCASVDDTWIFASEIKGLLAFPGAFRGFNARNVERFVNSGQVDWDETTIFAGIYAVPPGTYFVLNEGKLARRRYWSMTIDDRCRGLSEEHMVAQYRELLTDSVRIRARSDVSIGTMLSGGLDSTSITALLHRHREQDIPDPASERLEGLRSFHHTVTACWPGWAGDEETKVDSLCRQFGLLSHKVYPTAGNLAAVLESVIYHLDEPFETPTALVQYLLMKKVQELGIKVVLNGHGCDEVLAGYPGMFVGPHLAHLLRTRRPGRFLSNYLQFLRTPEWTHRDLLSRIVGGAGKRGARPPDSASSARPTRSIQACTGHEETSFAPWYKQKDMLARSTELSPVTALGWRAFSTTILPKWLRMEDRVSMACSVESRLPFMDYRLVEFGFNLPDEIKLRNGLTKFILRNAMKHDLPASIVYDRVKTRFGSPYEQWFRSEWRDLVADSLLRNSRLASEMDMAGYQAEVRKLVDGKKSSAGYSKLWRALNAEICLRTFSNSLVAVQT